MARQTHDREFWRGLVARYKAKDRREAGAAFAKRHGVELLTLRWWAWRLGATTAARSAAVKVAPRKPKAPALLPVRVIASTAPLARWLGEAPRAPVEIVLAGCTLRVAVGTDLAYVAALVQQLSG